MGFQNNFNNNLFQVAQIAILNKINSTLEQIGCNSIDELNSKIQDIDIQIATLQDQGKNPKNLKILRDEYIIIRNEYYKAEDEAKAKIKKRNRIIGCIAAAGCIIYVIAMLVIVKVCVK